MLLETAIPQQRKFYFDTSFFSQSFDDYGFDDDVNGYKTFLSYGDKFGAASVNFSYNRLQNDSQPQTFYTAGSSDSDRQVTASGAIPGVDSQDRASRYFGDTGVVNTTTDNLKFKLGYDFERWSTLLNVAYENRSSITDSANSYVSDAAGNAVYSGDFMQNGEPFSIDGSRLNVSEADRESLSLGLRLRGELSDSVAIEANASLFDILEDEARSSALNPNDPGYASDGEVTAYDDTGWRTADVKLTINNVGITGVSVITGLRYEAYELNFDVYGSDDWYSGTQDTLTGSSGGKTDVSAAFMQLYWNISERWDASLGGRYESFESSEGYFANDDEETPGLDLTATPGTSRDQFSPKFSLGFRRMRRQLAATLLVWSGLSFPDC